MQSGNFSCASLMLCFCSSSCQKLITSVVLFNSSTLSLRNKKAQAGMGTCLAQGLLQTVRAKMMAKGSSMQQGHNHGQQHESYQAHRSETQGLLSKQDLSSSQASFRGQKKYSVSGLR